ncbi:hypothetical protein [Maricaulis maris]|uniref:hypothetical protein n=1 Tax=Maricaulis maris TaxID=74318 RepID=UPI003B8B28A3
MRTRRPTHLFRPIPVLGLAAVLALSGCSRDPAPLPDEVGLPAAALSAFQAHLRTMSEGDLVCPDAAIEAAPRVTAYLNDDRLPDYAIATQDLDCESEITSSVAYFCGGSICAFPALVSEGEDYRVVWLMSGNEIEAQSHYREERFVVRQLSYAGSRGSAVLVREYSWIDGALRRVAEREEVASR